jgi:hypothetical protein
VRLAGPLVVAASRVEVRDLSAPVWKVEGGSRIVLRRLDVNLFFIHGGESIRVLGGDVGPTVDADSQVTSADGQVPRGIRIVGVFFHDARKQNPETHIECLQFGSGIDVAIVRSRFTRCADHDILVRSWASIGGERHPLERFRIEQNVLDGPTRGTYSLRLAPTNGWTCDDFLITRNVALANMYSDCDADGVRFVDNAQPSMSEHTCSVSKGAVWQGNLYGEGVRCGSGDRVDADAYGRLRSQARTRLGG